MQTQPLAKRLSRFLLAASLLIAACARQDEPAGHEDHTGHDHEGHDHASSHAPGTTDAALMCTEHNVLEAECGICNPDTVATLQPGESLKVRLPSPDSAKLVGVESAAPRIGSISSAITCYAELAYNQRKYAVITAPVGGLVQDVLADLGHHVQEGQPLAKLWSAEIAGTVARAVLSHQTLAREQTLRAEGVAPAKDLQEAEAAHREACQAARTLGFSEADIDTMGQSPDETILLSVRAPFAGEVVELSAVRGSRVETGASLMAITDRSTVWANLSLAETDLARVALGQTVELDVDALPGITFTGTVTWIATEIDAHTRLARARAEFPNPDGRLKARMFARARILVQTSAHAVLVPNEAIATVEGNALVFVPHGADLYEARAVRLGATHNGQREILAGLQANESIVVRHGFNIKSQLLASRLGAGCAHE